MGCGGVNESMKKMNIAICDDEASILSIVSGAIETTLRRYDIEAVTEIYESPKDLEHRMREIEFQLIFLDIDMPQMNGITFARRVRKTNSRTDIIFISNREDLVFDALRVNPAGFIRKKRFLEDVSAVLDQWMQNRKKDESNILVADTPEGEVSVPLDKLLYIEGSGRNQYLHIAESEKPLRVSYSMQTLEEQLAPLGFLRVHKGYIVNYRFIRRLKEDAAVLTNGEEIPMSRLRVADVRSRYLELMQAGENVIL